MTGIVLFGVLIHFIFDFLLISRIFLHSFSILFLRIQPGTGPMRTESILSFSNRVSVEMAMAKIIGVLRTTALDLVII